MRCFTHSIRSIIIYSYCTNFIYLYGYRLREYKQLEHFHQCINVRYNQDGSRTKSDPEENMADNIGLLVSFTHWQQRHSKDRAKLKCFLMTFIRMWCSSRENQDNEHASGFQRGVYTLSALDNTWTQLFKCNKTLLNKNCF